MNLIPRMRRISGIQLAMYPFNGMMIMTIWATALRERNSGNQKLETKESEIKERKNDIISTYWMNLEKRECFNEEATVMVVEVAHTDHGKEKVLKAKGR